MKARSPLILKLLLPQLTWKIRTDKKEIYVTFDDGPHPEITPRVMDILEAYDARGTFFCVGQNVERYPDVYRAILERGHKTGNHTYNHLNGWKVSRSAYFDNILKCASLVDSHLFRPPYGRIGMKHIPYLKMNYRIVMWSVLSMDYDQRVTPEKCRENVLKYTKKGSIVVFHDSEKASRNLLFALPAFLEHFKSEGYLFPPLSSEKIR
jgi:peptidoglycan/xylan/chitin deacetylase (PgdA/CDA1 family)